MHLPLCPLFCLGLGFGVARNTVESNQGFEERGAISSSSAGYTVVQPYDERHYNNNSQQTTQATLYNSINPQGSVSTVVAEAYLVPPLQLDSVDTSESITVSYDAGSGFAKNPSSSHIQYHPNDDDGGATSLIIGMGFGDFGMFKDLFFAFLFIAGSTYVLWTAASAVLSADDGIASGGEITYLETAASVSIGLGTFALLISSSLFLGLLMKYSEHIITASITMSIVSFAILSVLSLLMGNIIMACICGFASLLTYRWLQNAASRIEFAATVLKTSFAAVNQNFWGIISVSVTMMLVQFVWLFMWSIAIVATVSYYQVLQADITVTQVPVQDQTSYETHYEAKANGWQTCVYVLMLLQLFWGIEVAKNVVASTVSGTLACWYFLPTRPNKVGGAFFRALTTSFGSICLGSLLVSILHTMRTCLSWLRNSSSRNNERRGGAGTLILACTLCMADFLLRVIESAMEYFNQYAFTYASGYGTNYFTSALRVMHLFKKRGWAAIITDSLISDALFLLILVISFTTGLFACLMGVSWFDHAPISVLFSAGFVVGMAVGVLISNIIQSAVKSIFVFYAEDPRALQRNHPDLYDQLTSKWMEVHPNTLFFVTGEMAGLDENEVTNAMIPSAPPLVHATPVAI